jgi:hypothetical protein
LFDHRGAILFFNGEEVTKGASDCEKIVESSKLGLAGGGFESLWSRADREVTPAGFTNHHSDQ